MEFAKTAGKAAWVAFPEVATRTASARDNQYGECRPESRDSIAALRQNKGRGSDGDPAWYTENQPSTQDCYAIKKMALDGRRAKPPE